MFSRSLTLNPDRAMTHSSSLLLRRAVTLFALLVLSGAFPLAGLAAEADQRTSQWLPYFMEPCRAYNVPLALALAIARQESGTRPWTINVAGKAYFPATREEAAAIAAKALEEGRSFDVGIMQVNSFWLKKYHIQVEEVLDPRSNIAMGVWILAREIQRYGLTWQAVGAYHTPLERNPDRARRYAINVINHMRAICQASGAKTP